MSPHTTETVQTDIGTVLSAITDPTRRQMLESLRAGPRSVGDIAADHAVSRPAISQHLRVLSEAGLVRAHKVGRHNYYAIDPAGLGVLRSYVDGFWTDVLAAFQAAALLEHAKGRKPN
jgi:DNA-binding transcriptional ArsR family regulator